MEDKEKEEFGLDTITSTITKGIFGRASPEREGGEREGEVISPVRQHEQSPVRSPAKSPTASLFSAKESLHSLGRDSRNNNQPRVSPSLKSEPRPKSPEAQPRASAMSNNQSNDWYDEAELYRESSETGGIELVSYVPTLPQLFLYLSVTQCLMKFFWFIAYCTNDHSDHAHMASDQKWFQITTWVTLGVTTLACFVYIEFVKSNVVRAIAATIFSLFCFVSFFQAPLTIADSARAYSATWAFFRCIFIAIIGILYTVAYREEIVPPREHLPPTARNFVAKHQLDTAEY